MGRKPASDAGGEKEIKFETAMKRLEQIVTELEKEDLDLEKSLALFEEGIRMSRICSRHLDQAEKKIEKLIREKEGELKTESFSPSGGEEAFDENDNPEPSSEDDDVPF